MRWKASAKKILNEKFYCKKNGNYNYRNEIEWKNMAYSVNQKECLKRSETGAFGERIHDVPRVFSGEGGAKIPTKTAQGRVERLHAAVSPVEFRRNCHVQFSAYFGPEKGKTFVRLYSST